MFDENNPEPISEEQLAEVNMMLFFICDFCFSGTLKMRSACRCYITKPMEGLVLHMLFHHWPVSQVTAGGELGDALSYSSTATFVIAPPCSI